MRKTLVVLSLVVAGSAWAQQVVTVVQPRGVLPPGYYGADWPKLPVTDAPAAKERAEMATLKEMFRQQAELADPDASRARFDAEVRAKQAEHARKLR
jgi:hypothetical protein